MKTKIYSSVVIGISCIIALVTFLSYKNFTHSSYIFNHDNLSQISVNTQTKFDIELKTSNIGQKGYDNVAIKVECSNKDQLQLLYNNNLNEYDIIKYGFLGKDEGFSITNNFEMNSQLSLTALEKGSYSINFYLIDLNNENNILTSSNVDFIAI